MMNNGIWFIFALALVGTHAADRSIVMILSLIISRVAPDIEFAGYPASGYPATGYLLPDIQQFCTKQ